MNNKHTKPIRSILTSTIVFLMVLLNLICMGPALKDCYAGDAEPGDGTPSYSRPSWLDSGPIVMVGNWDSAPIFRYRRGGTPTWSEEEYAKAHSEEAVIKLKEMGVTMAIIHFYKGFGLEAEKEQLEDARKLAALCKKHGLRVGVYVGSTVGFETFLLERPDAQEWFVPDFRGQPILWDWKQPFRKRVYFMHPEYRDYIKKVIKIAIEELKADLIHFDNTSERANGPVFFHPMAKDDFRSYLRENYSAEYLKSRLGFSEVKYIEPPMYNEPSWYSGPTSKIDNPLVQMWTDFRCSQMNAFYGEMGRYIRGLNPETAVENNPCFGLGGWNHVWSMGMDYPKLLAHTDIIWTEEGNEADYSEEGILISKIRTYKMATTLHNKIFTYTGESVLQIAEAMAYNRQCIGMVGGMLAGYELTDKREKIGFDNPYSLGAYSESYTQMIKKAEYINFFQGNFDYYRDIDNIADAAVLHSYSTLAFNNDRPYQSVYLFEQALIQAKVPFDIIFDDNLSDLSKYKVLILADVECLSEDKIELIRKFVQNGGGLVATEHSTLYTEWRRRKKNFGLKDLFQVDAPRWLGRNTPESILEIEPVKNSFGRGRVVYLPEVKPAVKKPPTASMLSHYWKLPLNQEEIIEAVEWAAGGELSLNVDAPETVTIEITEKKDRSCVMLHLLNYDSGHGSVIKNIRVSLEIPDGKSVASIIDLSPDNDGFDKVDFTTEGKRVLFKIPELDTYEIAVINLRNQ
ncbi:MAG: beta-galactosidase trimerization domain-containing protein [Gemmatimonadota bacterium]|nr:beta-galactosidase trimerization domain-containing protein [Gemmatimonadota bacterium]